MNDLPTKIRRKRGKWLIRAPLVEEQQQLSIAVFYQII